MRRAALTLLVFLSTVVCASAGEGIPREALRYRSELVRNARVVFGLDAPVAMLAGQITQESGWNPAARSPVGAQGLAQFMPATSKWIATLVPELQDNQPYNPGWALRAVCEYMDYLLQRAAAATDCDRAAFALSGYNGGEGWRRRDQKLAAAKGFDPLRWWDSVELVNAGRSSGAWKENRGYPRRILLLWEPLYSDAGWTGKEMCYGR